VEERLAAGEHFDQKAFLQAIDWEEQERGVVLGVGARQVHLFLTPESDVTTVVNIASLSKALESKHIALVIHPLSGANWHRAQRWAAQLVSDPSGWTTWVQQGSQPTETFSEAQLQIAEATLRGSARCLARLGINTTPSLIGLALGKKPHPLDPVTLEDATGSINHSTTGGLLKGKTP